MLIIAIAAAAGGGSNNSSSTSSVTEPQAHSKAVGQAEQTAQSKPAPTQQSQPAALPESEKEARAYISQKGHLINIGRVDYEHVVGIVAIASKEGGESGEAINELAKVAQEAHNEIDSFREELFQPEGDKKLSEATFQLSEGANELKNAMGALVAYTGNPNPATLAHFTTQLEAAKGKWNEGAEEIWRIAHESGAMTLK